MEIKTDKIKPTIIHLLSHYPNPVCLRYKTPEEYIKKHDNAEFIKTSKFPYWIGFFEDFNHKIAKDTLNRTEKFNLECWRPYWNIIDRSYEKMFDGILHKVFPAKQFRITITLDWMWSKSFLNELKTKINNKEKILIHIHDSHSSLISWLLLKLKPLNIPVLYQHRGGWFSNFQYEFRSKNPVALLNYRNQKKIFKYLSYYYSGSKFEYEFLKNELQIENASYYMDGVDFDYFMPGNKMEKRKGLNLPLNKKIILYVGRFDATNGVDKLIKTYKRLKGNDKDIELLMVGGFKNNPSYKFAVDSGAIVVERIQEEKLLAYYQAADIYTFPIEDYLYRAFGGIGTATIQALACGLPVLGYSIMHLPSSIEEINKIGRTFKNEEDMYQQASYMLNNINEFNNCREITRKYYDKNITMQTLIDKYEELFDKYY